MYTLTELTTWISNDANAVKAIVSTYICKDIVSLVDSYYNFEIIKQLKYSDQTQYRPKEQVSVTFKDVEISTSSSKEMSFDTAVLFGSQNVAILDKYYFGGNNNYKPTCAKMLFPVLSQDIVSGTLVIGYFFDMDPQISSWSIHVDKFNISSILRTQESINFFNIFKEGILESFDENDYYYQVADALLSKCAFCHKNLQEYEYTGCRCHQKFNTRFCTTSKCIHNYHKTIPRDQIADLLIENIYKNRNELLESL